MKIRIFYYLLATITFTGFSILFSVQQSYAQSPTPSPAPTETTTPSPDSTSTETTSPSSEETTDLPPALEDANLPQTLDTPTPSPITQSVTQPNPEDVFGFDFLGFEAQPLRGPTGSLNFTFGVPADWELEEGTELQLNFSTFFDYLGLQNPDEDPVLSSGGSLGIFFNDNPLTTLALDEVGEQSVTIPIPAEALTSARADRRHELEINLESGLECGSDLQTSIIVDPTSRLVLPHRLVAPSLDLRLLPWPIQQRSFVPDLITIVTPNQPTEIEMQAALTVAAGLGKMTFRDLTLSLTPIGQLTTDTREANHLIFVGTGEDFPILKDLDLPAPIGETGFEAFGAFPEDGIIQMAVSPWNSSRAILIVGGESEAGLTKASQAISVGEFLTSGRPDLALIAEVQSEEEIGNISIINQSLADLGYSTERAGNVGSNRIEYEFEIPGGYIADTDAYLDLTFNHSALLDLEQSGALIRLNNQSIGSLRFSEESISLTTTRLTIPRSAIRAGINTLTVEAALKPNVDCYDIRLDAVWLTVWPESTLYLPLQPVEGEIRALFELNDYPKPFESNPTLNNVAFVLGVDDLMGWNVATQVAYDLGNRARPVMADFAVAYGDNVSESIRQNHHMLIIGRPSKIPLLVDLSEALPVPFEPESDIAIERGLRVRSRLLPDASIGYMETIPAPWNRNWSILALLGSTDQGVEWSGAALTTNQIRNRLNGNLAIIDNEHVSIGDRRLTSPAQNTTETPVVVAEDVSEEETVPENITELEPVADATAEPTNNSDADVLAAQISEISATPYGAGNPNWLLPALMGSISLMVIIVAIVMISAWRQHRLREE